MKVKQLLVVTVLCWVGSGCRLTGNLCRSTIVEPIQYASHWAEKREEKRFRCLAQSAFESERANARAELDDYEHEPFSLDTQLGFEDGFVDFLLRGGTGHAPPLPPRRYWKAEYQNRAGLLAVQQWSSGYEHGAAVAQASGFREFATVPVTDLLVSFTEPNYDIQVRLDEQADGINDRSADAADDESPDNEFEDLPVSSRLSAASRAESWSN